MANILRDELIENNYVSTNNIDNELPPTHVVLYLKNKSTIDKKIIVEPIPLQQILLSNQNPSLRLIDNKAVFCLSPPSMQEISCEGATNSISFPSLVGAWTVLFGDIDGEPNVVEGDINGISTGLDSLPEFESSSDGSIYIGNVSDSHVRFKFVPHDNDDPVPSYIAPTDNPTFMEHDDGSLTFCLKQASCLATSTSTSFPEHLTNVPDAVYYLSFTATENNVAATRTVSFNSDTQYTYTYTSIFNHLMEAAGYSYVGDPVEGLADVYSLLDLDVFNNILSGLDSTKINWANQSRPIDIQFIETPVNNLIGENGLQAIDLYPMLKTQNGNAPASLHSCGYGIIASTRV